MAKIIFYDTNDYYYKNLLYKLMDTLVDSIENKCRDICNEIDKNGDNIDEINDIINAHETRMDAYIQTYHNSTKNYNNTTRHLTDFKYIIYYAIFQYNPDKIDSVRLRMQLDSKVYKDICNYIIHEKDDKYNEYLLEAAIYFINYIYKIGIDTCAENNRNIECIYTLLSYDLGDKYDIILFNLRNYITIDYVLKFIAVMKKEEYNIHKDNEVNFAHNRSYISYNFNCKPLFIKMMYKIIKLNFINIDNATIPIEQLNFTEDRKFVLVYIDILHKTVPNIFFAALKNSTLNINSIYEMYDSDILNDSNKYIDAADVLFQHFKGHDDKCTAEYLLAHGDHMSNIINTCTEIICKYNLNIIDANYVLHPDECNETEIHKYYFYHFCTINDNKIKLIDILKGSQLNCTKPLLKIANLQLEIEELKRKVAALECRPIAHEYITAIADVFGKEETARVAHEQIDEILK